MKDSSVPLKYIISKRKNLGLFHNIRTEHSSIKKKFSTVPDCCSMLPIFSSNILQRNQYNKNLKLDSRMFSSSPKLFKYIALALEKNLSCLPFQQVYRKEKLPIESSILK